MIAQLARKCLNLVLVVFLLTGCRGEQSPTPVVERASSTTQFTYDPNDNLSFRSLNYLLNAELTRTIGNTKPVFHVTPDSQYSLCD